MKVNHWNSGWVILAVVAFLSVPESRAKPQQPEEPQVPQSQAPAARGDQEGSRRIQEGRARGVFGKVSSIQKDTIEITNSDGSRLSFKLTGKTEFRKERQPAKLADFKVGDTVMVRIDPDSTNSSGATAWMVASVPEGFTGRGGAGGGGGVQAFMQGTMGKDFVVGEVKSVDAPKLTVLRVDNVTQTLELNEETSLRRGRDSITMADMQPGDHIFARGAVANEVFVPRNVNVIPPEQWKRMQEMREGRAAPSVAPQTATPPATPPNPPEQPH